MWWNKLSKNNQNENNQLEQYVAKLQNEIILIHNKSQEISVGAFNQIIQQLQQAIQLLQQKEAEIKRLEGLCDANKIDYKPKASPKEKK